MKLKTLIKGIPNLRVYGSKDVSITGVCGHSRFVAPGNLFIARRGKHFDGSTYISDALAAGAHAVLTDIFDPSLTGVTQVIHPHPQSVEPALAMAYYQQPSRQLYCVGITGTNGKTTTTYILRALLESMGIRTGLIGSVEYIVSGQHYQSTHTTPDVLTCHKLLREMQVKGCHAAVMEVTSHGLEQGRVEGVDFDIALFTNFSQDHLDYHGNMEAYAAAKRRLFESLTSSRKKNPLAVVNGDDPWADRITQVEGLKRITYGLTPCWDVWAEDIVSTVEGTAFTVCTANERCRLKWPLIGRFNVYNALGAISVCLSRQFSLTAICENLATFQGVAGRLERVKNACDLQIFVDFSHTPDALSHAQQALRAVCKGRLITVFGCGGDRDKSKRPLMAKAVENGADIAVLTSDNPRSEDPQVIIDEVLVGFQQPEAVTVRIDRREAISYAISEARPEDCVLIAGKGHETYQILAHKTVDFDDRQVAEEACRCSVAL